MYRVADLRTGDGKCYATAVHVSLIKGYRIPEEKLEEPMAYNSSDEQEGESEEPTEKEEELENLMTNDKI